MNYSRILEHAFDVVRRHRAFWILGFLWALFGGSGGGGGSGGANFVSGGGGRDGGGGDFGGNADLGRFGEEMERLGDRLAQVSGEQWVTFAIGACLAILVLIVLTTIARYVLMAGVLRSLDALDRDDVEPTVRGAWHEGWHRRTWRPFLQNLIVDIPFGILAVLALLPVAVPILLSLIGNDEPSAPGIIGTVCLFCCWILLLVVVSTVVEVLKQLWWRAAVLDDEGFLEAIGSGTRLANQNRRQVAATWLLMFVVGIVWGVLSIVLLVAFGAFAALVAGGPAYLLYQSTGELLWPLVYGIPVGVLTFVVPLIFVSGLYLVFQASVWTQVYRQLPNRPVIAPPAITSDPLGVIA